MEENIEDIMATIVVSLRRIPFRTSSLSGEAYLRELLESGHPRQIHEVLRLSSNH